MAWTTPRTWVAGELVTAALMNTFVRDDFAYLKDSPTFDGSVIITSGLTVGTSASIGTTLAVTGATTLSSTLAVTGTATFNGDMALGNAAADTLTVTGTVVGAPLKTYTETRTSPTISGGSLILDCSAGTYFKVALNANCTVDIQFQPADGRALGVTVIFTADGTVRTITWPASVTWPSGVAPTMTGTNNKRDIITLITENGGVTWFGVVVGQNY